MPRLKPALTINLNFHESGEKYKIELCRFFGRFRVRFNCKNSKKFEDITLSDFCVRFRKFIKIKL